METGTNAGSSNLTRGPADFPWGRGASGEDWCRREQATLSNLRGLVSSSGQPRYPIACGKLRRIPSHSGGPEAIPRLSWAVSEARRAFLVASTASQVNFGAILGMLDTLESARKVRDSPGSLGNSVRRVQMGALTGGA